MSEYIKDPDAVLDYKFDWKTATNGRGFTDWLASGETIISGVITAEAGLTVDSYLLSDSSTSVIGWLSGGTAGDDYTVTCRITTSAGRTDDRSITIKCQER